MPSEGDAVPGQRILFVTGKLAEPALRRAVAELAEQDKFEPQVAVLPISVAALLTTDWVASHLGVEAGDIDKVMVPGLCRGEISELEKQIGVPVERGPKDVRELPEHFGSPRSPVDLTEYDIEIIAEINHAPQIPFPEIVRLAKQFRADGADVIDLGCNPGQTWTDIADVVKALREEGLRASVDSFNLAEVMAATKAGAELVLSVNSSNVAAAKDWGAEVVAVPDEPAKLDTLHATVEQLLRDKVRFRLDPILEPIGFGFAASMNRYAEVRKSYPKAEIMMGVGNLTEMTDADSAGINVLLAGYCQELGIRSVLTTQVGNWCRSCVKELDLARRLVYYSVRNRVVPKRLCPELMLLRDPKLIEHGDAELNELAAGVTDRNYRLFAEHDDIHVINGAMHLRGDDPFALFEKMLQRDGKIDAAHAFYLGYEMAKAITALTLGKDFVQDNALNWGFLTRPEESRHSH
jgi:dihydropteroate synthase-like protein